MKQIKKTPADWFLEHRKEVCVYRTLAWRFEEEEANNKITEKEYVNRYVHPKDRWQT